MVEGNSNGENSYTSVLTFESHIHGSGILVYNWALPKQTRFLLCLYNILYLHTHSHMHSSLKKEKRRGTHMHMQGEGGNYLDLVAQINNTYYYV